MTDPIELTKKDIIPRPKDLPVKTGLVTAAPTVPGSIKPVVKEIKESLGDIKEIKDMLAELGIKIPGLTGQAPADAGGDRAAPAPPQPSAADQLLMLVQMLRVKYGNITVNELIRALVQEYGDRKLSTIGGK